MVRRSTSTPSAGGAAGEGLGDSGAAVAGPDADGVATADTMATGDALVVGDVAVCALGAAAHAVTSTANGSAGVHLLILCSNGASIRLLRPAGAFVSIHLSGASPRRPGSLDLGRRPAVLGRHGVASDGRSGRPTPRLGRSGCAPRLRLRRRDRPRDRDRHHGPAGQQRRFPAQLLQRVHEQRSQRHVSIPPGVTVAI